MKQRNVISHHPPRTDREIPLSGDDGRMESPCQKGHRLHLKAQRVLLLWAALFEGRIEALPSNKTGLFGKAFPRRYSAEIVGAALLGAGYALLMNEWSLAQPIMWRLSIWLGAGILGVLYFEERQFPLSRLFWPLWVGWVAAVCNISVSSYLFVITGLLALVRSDGSRADAKNYLRAGIDFIVSYSAVTAVCIRPPSDSWTLMGTTSALMFLQGFLAVLYMEMGERRR